MTRYAKTMSQALAEMQEAKKITKKERDSLENDNQHGELALKLAQSFGTPQEVKKIKDINKRHMKAGSIDPKDQKERDAISNKYYKMAESLEEGYESEVLKILDDAGIDGYFKNNKLYVSKRDARDAKKALDDSDEITKLPKMVKEGTWKMPDNPKEVAALKKLMSRPLPIGNTEDDKLYKDSANAKLYGLLGDDELFDDLGALEDKGKEKADARPVIIKWFRQRAKDNRYDLGDRTKDLGKQIGLRMEYVPEGLDEKKTVPSILMPMSVKKNIEKMVKDRKYKGNTSALMKDVKKKYSKYYDNVDVQGLLQKHAETNESNRIDNFDENYRKLAMKGIGTETKKAAKVGLKTDYYLPKNGDKSFGKITRVTSSGYEITDEKTKKVHKFKFYDPNNDPTSVRGTREEVELTEKVSKELAAKVLSMMKNQKFVKVSGDFVPEIYLSAADRDELKKEFGRLPRGFPSATQGMPVVDMINHALGKDGVIDTEGGDTSSPKLISWDKGGKTIGRPKTVGDAAKIAGVRLESVELDEKSPDEMVFHFKSFADAKKFNDYAEKNKQKFGFGEVLHFEKGRDGAASSVAIRPKDGMSLDEYEKLYNGINKIAKKMKSHKSVKFIESIELDEAKYQVNYSKNNKLYSKTINAKDEDDAEEKAIKKFKIDDDDIRSVVKETLDEKYDLYHKTFSDAMQHAYDYAKKKLGITVDPKEIDSKVATGPKKPSEGKTNKYRLKGKGGNLQIQVYNKGGSKPFELNMYKEENDMTKSLKDTILEMWTEASNNEGNAFTKALADARKNGDKTFVVSGKTYNCEDYDENGEVKEFVQSDGVKRRVKEGDNRLKANRTETNKNDKSDDGDGLDAVQPKAVKKKFKDRKDKDIDNDGDVDDSDKFLHKRRKAVSKAIKNETNHERYLETKKGSLRDAILQMWGEKKDLTKEMDNGKNKKTDTGKEVTPVDMSPKMPKVKESKNKV